MSKVEETDLERTEMQEARAASRILNDPAIVKALEDLEVKWLSMFRASAADEPVVREECHRLLNVLDLFKRELQHALDSGNLAAAQVKTRQQEADVEELERREGIEH